MPILDETDLAIIKLLQEDCRLSSRDIGLRLHKSKSAIHERIKHLQDEGIIAGYSALLNPAKIGRGMMAFTHVQLKDHSEESLVHFEDEITELPEVLECYHMSGQYDFILRVAVRDMNAYHEFLMGKLFKILSIGSVQSTFVMKEAKSVMPFPMERA